MFLPDTFPTMVVQVRSLALPSMGVADFSSQTLRLTGLSRTRPLYG